jgi:hypothetical protein
LRKHIKIKDKSQHYKDYLPFTQESLNIHLASLWEEGMSWDNYGKGQGKWEIDHRIPLKFKNPDNSFYWDQKELEILGSETFKKFWDLSNLQPKWSIDNLKKSNKFID